MSLRQSATRLLRGLRLSPQSFAAVSFPNASTASGKLKLLSQVSGEGYTWSRCHGDKCYGIFFSGQTAIMLSVTASLVFAEASSVHFENDATKDSVADLSKLEDGSVISNIHTSKWRVFTDYGRDSFLKGKLEEAQKFFVLALQEAKEGFGERDPHVASSCNNLAELYRVKKQFDKAEPLYLDAIDILEESFGPQDIRVGAALHNLGQFYLVQRKLGQSCLFYERALKIKKRVLGENHIDYADTMYHLGTVLFLLGKQKDSVVVIQDSIRILEEGGRGESNRCIKRLRYLAQVYINSNQLVEAENVQRKILHIMELSKGWKSLDTVLAAEDLAFTFQLVGRLQEAHELLQRCLDVRKTLLPEVHIQIAANALQVARVKMLIFNQLKERNISDAVQELNLAKNLLHDAERIAQHVLLTIRPPKAKQRPGVSGESGKEWHAALLVLLQSHKALGQLEISKLELYGPVEKQPSIVEAELALHQCISAFKEFGTGRSVPASVEIMFEYLSCLKLLSYLISDVSSTEQSKSVTLEELSNEIKAMEAEITQHRNNRKQMATD